MSTDNVNEVYVEKVHSRKSKTNFKGVIQKMLISSLVLTSVLGTSSAAFAAEAPKMDMSKVQTVAYENGISVETALQEIKTTISKLKLQVSGGFVQTETLKKLASQLSQLEKSANGQSSSKIISTLDSVESVVKGINGNEKVMVALQSVRDSLGIVSVTEDVKAPKANAKMTFLDDATIQKDFAWAYNSIMEMADTNVALINGKPVDVDGQKHFNFDPSGTMTRAEYVNIAVKATYPEELASMTPSNPWYLNAFTVAKQHGILLENDPNFSDKAGEGISREEMALILIRVAHDKGISTDKWVYQSQIPDFKDVSPYYQSSVRECYTLGLLNGTDQKGTFAPKGTLDRASAAQTFYKLLHADKRTPVAPQSPTAISPEYGKPSANLQTFKEGEPHTPAQAGDTVIKADGTQVVLTMNQVGDSDLYLLGFGQGVDIITGTRPNPNSDATWGVGYGAWYDDDGTVFYKYDVTGEVYTSQQWTAIYKALYNSIDKSVKGTTDGELLGDYFRWDGFLQKWSFRPGW